MPRQRNDTPRCSEPYYEEKRGRWRVIKRDGSGEEERPSFATERQAWNWVKGFRATIQDKNLTCEEAIEAFFSETMKDNRPKTLRTARFRLTGFFGPKLDRRLMSLKFIDAQVLYQAYQSGRAVATHQAALSLAKTFFRWAVKAGYALLDVFADVEPFGTPNRGKEQLRVGESRKFVIAAALAYLQEHDEGGLAVLMALLLGLRTGEVINCKARDVDMEGRLLWITEAKTNAGIRQIEVPEPLCHMLWTQARYKGPEERLFEHYGQSYVRDKTKQLCAKAGVLKITGQGLRGTHATLAMQTGITPHLVAQSLGHTSPQVTTAHYAIPGSVQSGSGKRLLGLLHIDANSQTQSRPQNQGEPKKDNAAQ